MGHQLVDEGTRELAGLGIILPLQVTVGTTRWVSRCRGTRIQISTLRALQAHLLGGRKAFLGTFFHEAGHAFSNVHRDMLSSHGLTDVFGDLRRPYNPTANLARYWSVPRSRSYVSSYAETHPAEDFAECFRVVVEAGLNPVVDDPGLQRKLQWVVRMINKTRETTVRYGTTGQGP